VPGKARREGPQPWGGQTRPQTSPDLGEPPASEPGGSPFLSARSATLIAALPRQTRNPRSVTIKRKRKPTAHSVANALPSREQLAMYESLTRISGIRSPAPPPKTASACAAAIKQRQLYIRTKQRLARTGGVMPSPASVSE
jgi:hypothetical protein